MANILAMAVPGFLVLIGVELIVARLLRRRVYRLNDGLSDLSCGIGDQVVAALAGGLIAIPYVALYEHGRLFDLDSGAASTWILAMLGKDLGYWCFHAFSHRTRVGWAAHGVHHQSEDYNLAVALRQSWFAGLYSWVFYLPLALLGVPPLVYFVSSSINLLYQFWIHTRLIGSLGPLEWVLNTPSHHRVHHGCDPKYLDRNYAGIFIVWDRLFRTFQKEEEEPSYGVVHPIRTWSPWAANIEPYADLIRDMRRSGSWWTALKIALKPPGWTPERGEAPVPLPGPGRGYDADPPRWVKVYALLQYTPGILGIVGLMAAEPHPWTLEQSLYYGFIAALLIATAVTTGALFDGRHWAWRAEAARVLVLGLGLAVLTTG